MFKKLKAGMGVGGAEVSLTLQTPSAYPGGVVTGVVDITGGSVEQTVEAVLISLVAKVEVDSERHDHEMLAFHDEKLAGFTLGEGERKQVPFSIGVPWAAPFTVLGGRELHKCFVGVRARLEIARSKDPEQIEPIAIYALPAHERCVEAVTGLDFRLMEADFSLGNIADNDMPFMQELEFKPPPRYKATFKEIELTFDARPTELEVTIDADTKRTKTFGLNLGEFSEFTVPYDAIDTFDWAGTIEQKLA